MFLKSPEILNLLQIINEPTRCNTKSPEKKHLYFTNLPSKFSSAVFCQDISDHCLFAYMYNGLAIKRPPLITIKTLMSKLSYLI